MSISYHSIYLITNFNGTVHVYDNAINSGNTYVHINFGELVVLYVYAHEGTSTHVHARAAHTQECHLIQLCHLSAGPLPWRYNYK